MTDNEVKQCSKCRTTKSINNFYKSKINRSGRYSSCKTCCSLTNKRYLQNLNSTQKKERYNKGIAARVVMLKKWEHVLHGIYGDFTCQICGKELILMSLKGGKNPDTVHFDHRTGRETIDGEGGPTHWLYGNCPNDENILKFKSCNFGILCNLCNRSIGSYKDRKARIGKMYKYSLLEGTI